MRWWALHPRRSRRAQRGRALRTRVASCALAACEGLRARSFSGAHRWDGNDGDAGTGHQNETADPEPCDQRVDIRLERRRAVVLGGAEHDVEVVAKRRTKRDLRRRLLGLLVEALL